MKPDTQQPSGFEILSGIPGLLNPSLDISFLTDLKPLYGFVAIQILIKDL